MFLPAVMTNSGRINGDFLCLLYILSHRQVANYFTRMGILNPSPQAFKQRRGTYFYYNRAAIGIACALMAVGVDPHGQDDRHEDRHRPTQAPSQKAPSQKPPHHVPDPTTSTSLHTPTERYMASSLHAQLQALWGSWTRVVSNAVRKAIAV